MNTLFQSIPTTEGVRKVRPGEAEKFNIAGAHLTWKAKSEDTDYAFSICEQTLGPDEGSWNSVRALMQYCEIS